MTNEKQYFTKEEMKERITEVLEYYPLDETVDVSDLHHDVFNVYHYIVYTSEAEKALEQYGVFNAIREIQEYEKNTLGEVFTDLSEPTNIVNMLWYIKGEQYMNDELELYQYETVGEMLEALQDEKQ